jgi:hypothetical protein
MNALQIKVHLFKKGLTISQIARDLEPGYDATFDSLRSMLTNLFYHGVRNDKLASLVESKYGIKVDLPRRPQSVREAVQRAAA